MPQPTALKATNHLVVSPRGARERFSAPFFYNPRLDARIAPLPFPGAADAAGVTDAPDNPLFAEFGRNERKGWVRAHPAVVTRHQPGAPPHPCSSAARTRHGALDDLARLRGPVTGAAGS
ncbi:hypothetical protein [Streptomyces sp. NPDC048282]|uniref:hypothetical protein n=1 Tax=Streptomyces sp. NPDC048282 TaxID=3365528 RepID=UPI003721D840